MYIANPIYDSVFKYLMDDNKVARLLLSAIIGEEIVSLNYTSKDFRSDVTSTILVLEIDFAAKIRSADGTERLVIIEIQKAKMATDIMRFRRYLGEQYASSKNVYAVSEPEAAYGKPLPILSIYFLGYELAHINAPVIKVQREYYDLSSGNKIKERDEFIESLTHDSFIIQIPALKQKRQNELLQVLSVFDQSNRQEDYHILNIKEEDFLVKYQPIIHRLLRAYADPQTRGNMEAEDRHLEHWANMQRALEEGKKALEESKKKLKEQDKIISGLKKKISDIK